MITPDKALGQVIGGTQTYVPGTYHRARLSDHNGEGFHDMPFYVFREASVEEFLEDMRPEQKQKFERDVKQRACDPNVKFYLVSID